MNFEYYPRGVCSRKMIFDIENGVVEDLKVEGGCSGNLQG
ncbi:MAG TPA: TSCPD domain-containing protein, partial [Ruminococcaceae bacterium]|nr:TSCPD domain-containing protein [Oscillospiraceae bacterium]